MTATDQDIDEYYAGDSLEIVVTVTEDGSAKDLSGSSVEWALSKDPGSTEELDESSSGVDASVTDAANGEVTIDIDASVTDDMVGGWHHEVRIEDGGGNKKVVTEGFVNISERVNQ